MTLRRAVVRREGEAVGAAILGATVLAFGLPRVAGVSWREIGHVLTQVTLAEVGLLTLVWLAGLAVHTIALAAALPGLSHRRAFFLNITGSAVSNLLPLGGTAGSAVNFWSARTWGFSTPSFLRWALATNIWDVLSRLAVPGIALAWLAASGTQSQALTNAGLGASAMLAVLLLLTILALRTESWARWAGGLADRVGPHVRRPPPSDAPYAGQFVAARASLVALLSSAWPRLTVGKALYAGFQCGLLWLCLSVLGPAPALPVVFAAFAVERVLSLAVISPAATGIVELGMTGFLVAMGVNPVHAAGSVVLYRIFVVGLEVPVGGLLLLGWVGRRLGAVRRAREGLTGTVQGTFAPVPTLAKRLD